MTSRRLCLVLTAALLMALPAHADREAEADSVYDRMVEHFIKGEYQQLSAGKDQAIRLFEQTGQWEHYYVTAMFATMVKVLSDQHTMAGIRESRKLYEFARDHHHDYGRAVVLSQMGWLYAYIGDHEESLKLMREAVSQRKGHLPTREDLLLIYNYAYTLERTGNYKEEARIIRLAKPLIQHYQWGDTASIIYHTYRDNLLNAETLLEVRQGRLRRAEQLVNLLHTKIANHDERNEYEALRAIAEYYKASGDYPLALAATDRMVPLAASSAQHWSLGLLRTEILRSLNRSDEAYDQLRPMIDRHSDERLREFRQQLSDIDAQTEIDELRIHRHKMQFWYAIGIGLLIIISLCILIIARHRAGKRIKGAYNQLQEANEQLHQAYDQLEETTTAKERIESELRIARNIQMSMVPSEFPSCDDIDLFASMTPAREVGGDLYDFLLLDNKELYFCVGDVSGKGVPASLFMAQTIRLFRALAKLQAKPADIARYMNRELSESNDSSMFVTMFIGHLQLPTGHLDFCNCGHNPPVLAAGSSKAHFIDMVPNTPIGLMPGLTFEGEQIDSIKGQALFVYTDGLNEAEDRQQQQFGNDRLLGILQRDDYQSSRHIIDTLAEAIEAFRNGAEPNDDLTMLCLKV